MIFDEDGWVDKVKEKAKELNLVFDGCTGVPDYYISCCDYHDFMYRTHTDINGDPVTRSDADAMFRRCIQASSRFKKGSPMAAWRWMGVRLFGRRAWKKRDPS